MTNNINGIDVSECKYYDDGTCCDEDVLALSCDKTDCIYKQLIRLQKENEKIKKQYNCYVCGNCGGKEDYINLEKHHKGLRKQFDELAKRNNTLSLRIEELEKENEELKKRQITKNGFICDCEQNAKYKQALEEIRKKITPVCACCDNIDGFTTWDDCENVCEKGVIKYLKIIDEALK